MTRKQLPFFVAFIVLMFGAMACACLGSGISVGGIQATAKAALTQAGAGASTAGAAASTAGAQGNSAIATAQAEATQAQATSAASGSGGGEATPTTGATGATAAATTAGSGGNGTTANGGPSDIPVISGPTTVQVATDKLLTYSTTSDVATVVKFYKDSMPANGWTQDTNQSVETSNAATLTFTKDNRTAHIVIGSANGQTAVAIAVE